MYHYKVNHTTEKLIESLNLQSENFEGFLKFDLHFKYRCDGSSEHSEYHQKVTHRGESEIENEWNVNEDNILTNKK